MKRFLLLFSIFISVGFAQAGAKYLIITHSRFYDAIQPLAQWKQKKGMPTKVVRLSEISSTTPESLVSPGTIKTYLTNAYSTWDPRPEYVLLVGNSNFVQTYSSDDGYVADVAGDYLMELSLGRFVCATASQCSIQVTKTLSFERNPYRTDTLWFIKGTGIVNEDGQYYDSVYWNDARFIYEKWREASYYQIDSFSRLGGHTATNIYNAIDNGRMFVFYRGQGVGNWTWNGDVFTIDPSLTNNGYKLPVVVAPTCATISLSQSGSYLGHLFVNAGSVANPKGAVAYLGTTQTSSGTGLARARGTVGQHFIKAVFKEDYYKLGDAFKRAKFMIDSIKPLVNGAWNTIRYKEWNLLGDPELNLWTAVPKPLTVLHDTVINTGPQTYTVTVRHNATPIRDALVCIMQDAVIYEYGYTNSSGMVSFLINPPTPETMSVTVTAPNYIPYERDVRIRLGGNVHDVGVYSIIEPQGTIISGTDVIPKVLVKNHGTFTDTFSVTFKIGSVYTQTINQVILRPGDTVTKSFPSWPAVIGNYSIKAWTGLVSDQWRANDTAFGSFSVVPPLDVGVDSIISPLPVHYVVVSNAVTPQAKIKNYGGQSASNFSVVCSIVSSTGLLRHTNTQTISLAVGRDTIVNFSAWTPAGSELCTVKIRTTLVGDANSANDRKARISNIVQIYQVVIGTATTADRYPFERYYNYATHEAIYLQSEINNTGDITHIAYERHSGPNTAPIENVSIYIRHTTATTLATGSVTLPPPSPYQLVYSGTFPNDAGEGWREVQLTTPFYYNNTDNLQILIVKGFQAYIPSSADCPLWRFTTTSPVNRTRRAALDGAQPTSLTAIVNRPNIAFKLSLPYNYDVGVISLVSPPERMQAGVGQNISALIKNFGLNQTDVPCRAVVIDSLTGTTVFLKDSTFNLMRDSSRTINFGQFIPATQKEYKILIYTALIGDEYVNNDTLKALTRTTQASAPDGAGYIYESTQDAIYGDTVTYNWINASSGTELTGWSPSSDDGNLARTLPFSFPYYGQILNSVNVNTNGFLQFPSTFTSQLVANQPLPYSGINNFIGGLWDDLNAGISGSKVYQYNDPQNQFVVFQWDSVPRYGQNLQRNTFQIILFRNGKIKFQYRRVSISDTSSTIGIQGGTGTNNRSLQYVYNGTPSYHRPTTGTAILFYYQKDAGVVSIEAPINTVDSGVVITPTAVINNNGVNPESVWVRFEISPDYVDTRTVWVQGNSNLIVGFTPWTARHFGAFSVKCSTSLTEDRNSGNDKITGSGRVRFHDVGALEITSPRNTQFAGSVQVSAKIKNFYTRTATCSTRFVIRNTNGNIVYNQVLFVSGLLPDSVRNVFFANFTANPGKYYTKVFTKLATDDNPLNDTLSDSLFVKLAAPTLTSPSPLETLRTTTLNFDWNDVFGASQYQIQIDNDNDFMSAVIDTVLVPSQLLIGSSRLGDGRYYWRVRAGVPFSDWSEIREFVLASMLPASPILVSPAHGFTFVNEPQTLIWRSSPTAVTYNLVISDSSYLLSDTFYIVNLTNGIYTWQVRAQNSFGNWSAFSSPRTFTVRIPVWLQKQNIRTNIPGKYVKDGGALTATENRIYAFRGNKSNEFYMYNGTSWAEKESMQFGKKPNDPLSINKKKVGKGSSLAYDGQNKIYATKGNGTRELWAYNIVSDTWTFNGFVPPEKGLKGGSSIVFRNGKIYLLAGGRKYEEENFFVYDTLTRAWITLSKALMPDAKPYKDGSCIALLNDTIYALKGSGADNYFSAYNINTNTWSARRALPLIHPSINKQKKVKNGGAMTAGANQIYAIKGGGSNEFWAYSSQTSNWTSKEIIPVLHEKSFAKAGAALACLNNRIYLLKGNNTDEFWVYTAPITKTSQAICYTIISSATEEVADITNLSYPTMTINPNPSSRTTICQYSVPTSGMVSIRLYDASGTMRQNIIDDFHSAGIHNIQIQINNLSSGIYFVKYQYQHAVITKQLLIVSEKSK